MKYINVLEFPHAEFPMPVEDLNHPLGVVRVEPENYMDMVVLAHAINACAARELREDGSECAKWVVDAQKADVGSELPPRLVAKLSINVWDWTKGVTPGSPFVFGPDECWQTYYASVENIWIDSWSGQVQASASLVFKDDFLGDFSSRDVVRREGLLNTAFIPDYEWKKEDL